MFTALHLLFDTLPSRGSFSKGEMIPELKGQQKRRDLPKAGTAARGPEITAASGQFWEKQVLKGQAK